MTALWFLYALAVGGFISVACVLAERAARLRGWRTGVLWQVAMCLSVLLPLAALVRGAYAAPLDWVPWTGRITVEVARNVDWLGKLGWLNAPLLAAWAIALCWLLVRLMLSRRALRRERRGWCEREVAGARVWVSDDTGPAALPLDGGSIVLPAWALRLDGPALQLLIAHEEQHVRARDPRVLSSALLLLALFPWNAALWWQFLRLKLALEVDCDARVLTDRGDVRGYADLLLEIGRRRRTGRLALAAFAAPSHAIERRIRIMTQRGRRRPGILVAACIVSAAGVLALACETPGPAAPDALRIQESRMAPPPPPPAPPDPGEYQIVLDQPLAADKSMLELEEVEFRLREKVGELRALKVDGKPVDGKYRFIIPDTRVPLKMDESVKVNGELPPPPPPAPVPGQMFKRTFVEAVRASEQAKVRSRVPAGNLQLQKTPRN